MDMNVKIARQLVKLAKSLVAEDEASLTDDEIREINDKIEVPFATAESSFVRKSDSSCQLDMGTVSKENHSFGNAPSDDFVLIIKKDGKFVARLFWFKEGRRQRVDVAEASTIEELGKKFDKKETTRTFGYIYDPEGLDTRW